MAFLFRYRIQFSCSFWALFIHALKFNMKMPEPKDKRYKYFNQVKHWQIKIKLPIVPHLFDLPLWTNQLFACFRSDLLNEVPKRNLWQRLLRHIMLQTQLSSVLLQNMLYIKCFVHTFYLVQQHSKIHVTYSWYIYFYIIICLIIFQFLLVY